MGDCCKSATATAYVYDYFFRKAFGDRVSEIQLAIWIEGGKDVKRIAESLGLPLESAEDASRALGLVAAILFGPEFEWETIEESENRAVDRIISCPFLDVARELWVEAGFGSCQAYCKSAAESMNPACTHRFAGAMCRCNPYCETVVEPKGLER